jgi:DNA-binding transcriptional regulator YiaG
LYPWSLWPPIKGRFRPPIGKELMTPQEFTDLRHRLDLTQRELAPIIGLASERNIRRWEDGERVIPQSIIILLDLIIRFPEVRRYLGVRQDKGVE